MTTLRADDVRAYLARGWAELEQSATRRDGAAAWELAAALYAEAREAVPGWPSPEERAADLEAHVRLAALFAKAHRGSPGGARSR